VNEKKQKNFDLRGALVTPLPKPSTVMAATAAIHA
jgi:hypothetical protein